MPPPSPTVLAKHETRTMPGKLDGFWKGSSSLRCGQRFYWFKYFDRRVSLLVIVDAREEIWKFLSRNWGICGRLKVFIVESSSIGAPRKYIEMHSQSQLKPSYKVTIFCTDKGKIPKVTPTPTLTKLQFCTWETNVRDMHVYVCYFWICMSVYLRRLSVECNWNPWQHNASQRLH